VRAALPIFGEDAYAAWVTAGASKVNALSLVINTSESVNTFEYPPPEPLTAYKHDIDVPVFHEAVAHALPPIVIVGELLLFSKLKPVSVRDAVVDNAELGGARELETGAS
jgi:hypothetical protein